MFHIAPIVILLLVLLFGALTFLPLFAGSSGLDKHR
jgi:hypothetical protein